MKRLYHFARWIVVTFLGERKPTFESPTVKGCVETNLYVLMQDYEVEIMDYPLYRKAKIRIAKGFVFDGASIPAILMPICGERMKADRLGAALVHDGLYREATTSRRFADWAYAQIQIQAGVALYRVLIEWIALRLFGDAAWQENRQIAPDKLFVTISRHGDAD